MRPDTGKLHLWIVEGTTYTQAFTYSKRKGDLTSMTPGNGHTLSLEYDALQRLSVVDSSLLDRYYTYRDISSTQTTGQVSAYQYKNNAGEVLYSYGYTYDQLGNIATYTENGTTYTYTYDAQNQLTQQTGGGKTYTYTYDAAGNILTASDGTASHTYTYGDATWKDLLTAFDGETITYDGSGNPTSYYNGTAWDFTWDEGRRLTSAVTFGPLLDFTYDSDGLRLTKKVGDTTYNYFYAGGKLIRQTWGDNTLDFFYDESGHPYALKYNGTTYYYVTNLQGDVLHIVDSSKQVVASYTYDPYGKVLTATGDLAEINPLRYRGYVYDSETGFYYLQSRYYDPTICRFINADSYASTGQGVLGNNMFAYCGNNPVNCIDDTGTDAVWIQEEDRAGGYGHSGLLVDDGEGNWYFLYWGSAGDPSWPQKIFGAPYKFIFIKIDVSKCDLSSVEGVAAALGKADNSSAKERREYVTGVVYLEGDYSETYKYLAEKYEQELSKPGSLNKYSLLANNCTQVTWKALEKSCSFFSHYKCSIIPNDTFHTVKMIDTVLETLTEV